SRRGRGSARTRSAPRGCRPRARAPTRRRYGSTARSPSSRPSCSSSRTSHVTLEDQALREAREALAHGAGTLLADALDGHEVVDARREEPLEPSEVGREPVDDGPRQAGDAAQEPQAARARGRVELAPARQVEDLGDERVVE